MFCVVGQQEGLGSSPWGTLAEFGKRSGCFCELDMGDKGVQGLEIGDGKDQRCETTRAMSKPGKGRGAAPGSHFLPVCFIE